MFSCCASSHVFFVFVSVIRCYTVFDSICCWVCWTKWRKFHPCYTCLVTKTTCSLVRLSDSTAYGWYVCVRYIFNNCNLCKCHCSHLWFLSDSWLSSILVQCSQHTSVCSNCDRCVWQHFVPLKISFKKLLIKEAYVLCSLTPNSYLSFCSVHCN